MSTTTPLNPEAAQALRTLASGNLKVALNRMVVTLMATPEEKLDYKPSDTAKSVRELVVHTLGGNGYVGGVLGLHLTPAEGPTDAESLAARLTSSTEAIIKAIEGLSDEAVSGSVEFFGHQMPMTAFMLLDDYHISRHAAQIDYIQTIYGDLEDHG